MQLIEDITLNATLWSACVLIAFYIFLGSFLSHLVKTSFDLPGISGYVSGEGHGRLVMIYRIIASQRHSEAHTMKMSCCQRYLFCWKKVPET